MPTWINSFASYGAAGLVIAGLASVLCILIGLYFASEVFRRFRTAQHSAQDTFSIAKFVLAFGPLTVAAFLLIGLGIMLGTMPGTNGWLPAYIVVAAFGGGVGTAELVSRYKDRPVRAISTPPALFYIGINALGSLGALYLISEFPDKVGLPESPKPWTPGDLVKAVLIAGSSSLLFFRTNLFKLRVGESDLAIGPSVILDALLGAADRAVDRVMAQPRAMVVNSLMKQVAFEKAAAILPAHCLALMQNVSSSETQKIVGVVNALRADKEMPDNIKAQNLGLALLTVVGETVLATAIENLKDSLQDSTAQLLKEVATVMRPVSFDRARRMLPRYCIALWPKEIGNDVKEALAQDLKALSEISDCPEEYKALILGIRLARLTDGETLRKAVTDLGASIKTPPAAPPQPPEPPQPDQPPVP